jgi:predicted Zn-dependent protease
MFEVKNTLVDVNNYMKERGLTGSTSFMGETSHMVRCGRSQISLNTSEVGAKYFVYLQDGKRKISGGVSCRPSDIEAVKKLVEGLKERLPFMPEVPFLKPMEAIAEKEFEHPAADDRVVDIESSVMVDLYKRVGEQFKDQDVEISGAFSSGGHSYGTINTLVEKPVVYEGADFNVDVVLQLIKDEKKELRASLTGEKLDDYKPDDIVEHLEVIHSYKKNTPREDLEPGEYDVVFLCDGFAELILYMSYMTLYGEYYQYEFGMLQKEKHQIGSKIFGDNITIVDDPHDKEVLYSRFIGMNGIERSHFPLIENGVLKNFYYSDKDTCDRFDQKVNNDFSVANMKLQPGDGPRTFKEMVKSCQKKTIYIPYVHYLNFTNPAKGEFTGTSRFGTFMMENGEINSHLFNLRINDSFHDIFNQVEWLSERISHVNTSDTYGLRTALSIACPRYVKVNNVKITGTSKV